MSHPPVNDSAELPRAREYEGRTLEKMLRKFSWAVCEVRVELVSQSLGEKYVRFLGVKSPEENSQTDAGGRRETPL